MGWFSPSRSDIKSYVGKFLDGAFDKLDEMDSLKERLDYAKSDISTLFNNDTILHNHIKKVEERVARLEEAMKKSGIDIPSEEAK